MVICSPFCALSITRFSRTLFPADTSHSFSASLYHSSSVYSAIAHPPSMASASKSKTSFFMI